MATPPPRPIFTYCYFTATKPNCENGTESVGNVEKKDKNHRNDDTDIIVIKALLISTCK